MPEMIGRRTALNTYASLPRANWRTQEFTYPPILDNYYLSGGEGADSVRLAAVTNGLTELLQLMSINEVLFFGDTSAPWLFRQGPFQDHVRAARMYLRKLGAAKNYTGGFVVESTELLSFLPHIFWLTRANAVSFDVNFIDRNETILCHPCKYFNLHFSTRTPGSDKAFKKAIPKSGLKLVGPC
ncbi:hypothetical protein [Flaviaesturariibacter terrae]